MDISRAFDRVWHKGLMVKLENNGIKGNLLNWFHNYLSGRLQRVTFNGVQSQLMPINAGVLQGSILGPILFLLYINDITHDQICNNNLFADDASVMETNDSFQTTIDNITLELSRIERWGAKWLITFSIPKTVFMIFSSKPNLPAVQPLIFCGGNLRQVESHTHLGMTLTRNLDWTLHINSILAKAYQRLNLLKMLRKILPREILVTLYFSMTRSILDYGCQVYCSLTVADSERLEQLQYRAGLIITGGIQGTSYQNVLNELGWSTLSERRLYFQASLMYKVVHGLCPVFFQNCIMDREPRNLRVSLRNADHLQIPRFRLRKTEKSFRVSSIRLWNSLPRSLRRSPSLLSFKLTYKKEFFPPVRRDFNVCIGPPKFSYLLYRFRLGFTTLNSDLGRRNIINDCTCACGTSPETYLHYFLECNHFNVQRNRLLHELDIILQGRVFQNPLILNRELLNILLNGITPHNKDNVKVFKAVLNFIIETRRFTGNL